MVARVIMPIVLIHQIILKALLCRPGKVKALKVEPQLSPKECVVYSFDDVIMSGYPWG